MNLSVASEQNENGLKANSYPGRGIIIGKSPSSKYLYQIYWIMGRSENSRNRIFEADGEFVRTRAFDESKMKDPSLIIYYPAKNLGKCHIITNGDQTDTIYDFVKADSTFEEAVYSRTFEPDPPNFTPRISGVADLRNKKDGYKLSILKSTDNNEEYCQRMIYSYEKGVPGHGHCIHTYEGDGNPLPSFKGEPYVVRVFDGMEENLNHYWSLLNEENRISLLVKQIDLESGAFSVKLVNKNK